MINLFSDTLYVANLLPSLPEAHIRLDSNPISPLMQAPTLLAQRPKKKKKRPLHHYPRRGHQNLTGFLLKGKQPG